MRSWKKKITTFPLFCGTRAPIIFVVLISTMSLEGSPPFSELAQARSKSSPTSSPATPIPPAHPAPPPPPPSPPPPPAGLPPLTPGPSVPSPRPSGTTHTIPVNYFFVIPTPTYDGNSWHNNGQRDLPNAQPGYVWFIFYSDGHYYAVQVPNNATITVGQDGRFIVSWTDETGDHSYILSPPHPMVVGQEEDSDTMQLYNFPPGTTMDIYPVHGTGVLSVEPGPGNPTGLSRLLSPPYGGTDSGSGRQHIRHTECPQVPCPKQPGARPPPPPAPPPPSGGSGGGSSWGGTSGGGGGGPGGGSGGGTSGGGSTSAGSTSGGTTGGGSTSSGTTGSGSTAGGTDGGGGPGCQTGDDASDCGEDENCDESIA